MSRRRETGGARACAPEPIRIGLNFGPMRIVFRKTIGFRKRLERMSRTGARILVVDSYPEADALASALDSDGHRVRRVADAAGAMTTLHGERADLAIVELTLPGWIDGVELASYLAAREVPVVLTSRAADAEERLKALPYPSLRKPHDPAEIRGQVRRVLRAAYGVA